MNAGQTAPVLQERKIERVGDLKAPKLDIRHSATNKIWEEETEKDASEDLFIVSQSASLPHYDRGTDICDIALFFLKKYGKQYRSSMDLPKVQFKVCCNTIGPAMFDVGKSIKKP